MCYVDDMTHVQSELSLLMLACCSRSFRKKKEENKSHMFNNSNRFIYFVENVLHFYYWSLRGCKIPLFEKRNLLLLYISFEAERVGLDQIMHTEQIIQFYTFGLLSFLYDFLETCPES